MVKSLISATMRSSKVEVGGVPEVAEAPGIPACEIFRSRWERSGFENGAAEMGRRWKEALALAIDAPSLDYIHCYPIERITLIVAGKSVAGIDCRLARPGTSEPIHR